jgi:hypothetical protein
VRTLKRKNVKGLALAAPPPRAATPSESDLQIPGGAGGYVECPYLFGTLSQHGSLKIVDTGGLQ